MVETGGPCSRCILNPSALGFVCQFLKHVGVKAEFWKEAGGFSIRIVEIAEASEQVN